MQPIRLAIVVSHPIQHFVHFYRALAKREELSVKVFFCSRIGMEKYFDKDMGTVIQWADDMTGGFEHEFLPEAGEIKKADFRSVNNPSIGKALAAFAPDAVVVYGYAQLTQLRVLAWCRINGVAVLMTTDSNAVTKRVVVKALLRQTALRLTLSQVSGFLTVGDQNEEALARVGVPRAKMYRSPFTIDETRYRMTKSERAQRRADIRAQYGIAQDAFVGIAVGKLIPRKRTQDVVEAFAIASRKRKAGRDLRLLVCGNGPDLEKVEQLVSDGAPATLAGFVNVDRLPDYFAAADVLVHAASRDAHPLICSEAACLGLPMILSDQVGTIGPTDISRRNENALVYPCADVDTLADCILSLAADPVRLKQMSAASTDIFEACSLDASLQGILQALHSVIRRAAAA